MNREELIEFIKENLELNIEESESYSCCPDDGSMYPKYHKVQLVLCGEVISSETLD